MARPCLPAAEVASGKAYDYKTRNGGGQYGKEVQVQGLSDIRTYPHRRPEGDDNGPLTSVLSMRPAMFNS